MILGSISWVDILTNLILALILFVLGTYLFRRPSFGLKVVHENNNSLVFYILNKKHYISYNPGEINFKLYLPDELSDVKYNYHIQESTGWTVLNDIPELTPEVTIGDKCYRLLRLDTQRMCFPNSSTGFLKISPVKIKDLGVWQIYFTAGTKYGFFPFYCKNDRFRSFLIRLNLLPKAKQKILLEKS